MRFIIMQLVLVWLNILREITSWSSQGEETYFLPENSILTTSNSKYHKLWTLQWEPFRMIILSEKKVKSKFIIVLRSIQTCKRSLYFSMPTHKCELTAFNMQLLWFFSLLLFLVDCQWNIYLTSVALPMSLNRWACRSAGRQSWIFIFLW